MITNKLKPLSQKPQPFAYWFQILANRHVIKGLYHISPNINDPNPSQYKSIHYPNHNMGLWLGTLYQDLLYMNNTTKIRFYDIVMTE